MGQEEIKEIEIERVIGLDEDEEDKSVGYYQPFCLVVEEDGKQAHIYMDFDKLLDIAKLLKPYLESSEANTKMEEEWAEENKR